MSGQTRRRILGMVGGGAIVGISGCQDETEERTDGPSDNDQENIGQSDEDSEEDYYAVDPSADLEIVAHESTGEQYTQATIATAEDFTEMEAPSYNEVQGWHIPVEFSPSSAQSLTDRLGETEVLDNPRACEVHGGEDSAPKAEWGYCIAVYFQGEYINRSSIGTDLAAAMESGEWTDDPNFVILVDEGESKANEIFEHLRE